MSHYSELKRKIRRRHVSQSTRDIFVFLFFVFISASFWCVQELEDNFSTEVSLPLKLTDVPDGVLITTQLPQAATLTLHGKGVDLLPFMLRSKLDTLRISYTENLPNRPTGHISITLNQLQQKLKGLLSNNITIQSVSPDTLAYHYNQGLHKRLPVRLSGSITAQQQYTITGNTFFPDSVDVYAPQAMLDTMRFIYTNPVELTKLSKSTRTRVSLIALPGLKASPDSVSMRTDVDILTRQSIEVPVTGLNFPADKTLRTFPSSVRVNYLATREQQRAIDPSQFVVGITYETLLNVTTGKFRPRLTGKPEQISGTLIDPVEVDFLIENITSIED